MNGQQQRRRRTDAVQCFIPCRVCRIRYAPVSYAERQLFAFTGESHVLCCVCAELQDEPQPDAVVEEIRQGVDRVM